VRRLAVWMDGVTTDFHQGYARIRTLPSLTRDPLPPLLRRLCFLRSRLVREGVACSGHRRGSSTTVRPATQTLQGTVGPVSQAARPPRHDDRQFCRSDHCPATPLRSDICLSSRGAAHFRPALSLCSLASAAPFRGHRIQPLSSTALRSLPSAVYLGLPGRASAKIQAVSSSNHRSSVVGWPSCDPRRERYADLASDYFTHALGRRLVRDRLGSSAPMGRQDCLLQRLLAARSRSRRAHHVEGASYGTSCNDCSLKSPRCAINTFWSGKTTCLS